MLIDNNRPYKSLIPKGVCIHWTANISKGANAIANRNYFANHPKIQASAHYIVDDNKIICCIPENEIAWHAGGNIYTDLAKNRFGSNPNKYLIGIEMCVNSDGDWNKTFNNTVELVADILKKYNWSTKDIYRHYDMTKKDCPRMMTPFVKNGENYFNVFKKEVLNKMADSCIKDWEKQLGIDAIKYLSDGKGLDLIDSPDAWEKKLGDNVPNWLMFVMLKRIVEHLDKKGV